MKAEADFEPLIQRLERIDWGSAPSFTSEAEGLLSKYAERFARVVTHFRDARGWSAFETEVHVCGGGDGAGLVFTQRQFDHLWELLSSTCPLKEHVMFNLLAWFAWRGDPELAQFPNPFELLLELYELGFTTSGGTSDSDELLQMRLGCRAGLRAYAFAL